MWIAVHNSVEFGNLVKNSKSAAGKFIATRESLSVGMIAQSIASQYSNLWGAGASVKTV